MQVKQIRAEPATKKETATELFQAADLKCGAVSHTAIYQEHILRCYVRYSK